MSGFGTYLEKPVNPLNYVRSIQRALGIEQTEETADRINLKEQLQQSLCNASPDALRRALDTLKNTNQE